MSRKSMEIASDPSTPPEGLLRLSRLSSSTHRGVLLSVLRNPNAPAGVLLSLVRLSPFDFLENLSELSILRLLANDSSAKVPETPQVVLWWLRQDESLFVRDAAKKNLAEREL